MDRDEIWVEDLEWIEADEPFNDMLESVLVVFDEHGSVLTVRDGASGPDTRPATRAHKLSKRNRLQNRLQTRPILRLQRNEATKNPPFPAGSKSG
jgi:hypothetical protein